MSKLNIAMKLVGCLVAGLILVGLVNPAFLTAALPFILAGTVATVGLYVLDAFKSKNYGAMAAVLILGGFILAIVCYNYFG